MGFFTDLKEDLAMAVNELMPEETEEAIRGTEDSTEESTEAEGFTEEVPSEENLGEENLLKALEEELLEKADTEKCETEFEESGDTKPSTEDFELEKMLENLDAMDMESGQENEALAVEETSAEEEAFRQEVAKDENMTKDEEVEKKMENTANRTISDETAVITNGMVINGDISSEGSMDVIGTINGNIDILGKLNITGTIQGDSKASEIFADNAKITGEVISEGSVKIGQSSVIIGNISATSAVIAGAVKGDIDVHGPVILDTSAIVMGNIKSKSVQINNGAVIEGMCSQCYAEVNPTSFFEDLKKNK